MRAEATGVTAWCIARGSFWCGWPGERSSSLWSDRLAIHSADRTVAATVVCGDNQRDARMGAAMAAACGRVVEDMSGRAELSVLASNPLVSLWGRTHAGSPTS